MESWSLSRVGFFRSGEMTDSLRIGWRPEVRSGGVAEYRRRPVLRQELKGKEEEEVAYRTVIVAMRCVIVSIYLPKM